MTDDTGMFQHSAYGVPELSKGYTADDNARALIMAVMLNEHHHLKKFEKLIYKYLSFICAAQNESGMFRNYMGYNREFIREEGSEDCFGRCVWALGFTLSNASVAENVKKAVWSFLERALPNCMMLQSPRAKGYVIIGLSYLNTIETNGYISKLADSLADQYEQNTDNAWHWFEDSLTYGNTILPWALLTAFSVTRKDSYERIGLESLQFLESKTLNNNIFKPIGCDGWLYRGEKPAEYDEQPIEACEMTLAYIDAYKITGNRAFADKAKMCFSWYSGNNSKNLSLIDPETGGCCDGIKKDGLNYNQGAESLTSFWIAYMGIAVYLTADKHEKA
jgi:hypothetical protein